MLGLLKVLTSFGVGGQVINLLQLLGTEAAQCARVLMSESENFPLCSLLTAMLQHIRNF